jgi:hypothetical protein
MKTRFSDKHTLFLHTEIQKVPKQALPSYMTQCMASPSHTEMYKLGCNILVLSSYFLLITKLSRTSKCTTSCWLLWNLVIRSDINVTPELEEEDSWRNTKCHVLHTPSSHANQCGQSQCYLQTHWKFSAWTPREGCPRSPW